MRARWIAGAVALLVVVSCSDSSADRPATIDRRDTIRRVVDRAIVPAVEGADQAAATFDAAVSEFCATPTDIAIDRARSATVAGWTAWERTATFDLGPAMERRSNSLVAYEADPAKIDARLAQNPPDDADTVRSRLRANLRGYGAADHLLASPFEPARCGYLRAIAATVRDETSAVAAAWIEGGGGVAPFARTARGQGADGWSATKVIDALVNMQLSVLQRTERRFTAYAEASSDQPVTLPPRAVSIERARIEGIDAIYATDRGGLAALLPTRVRGELQARIDDLLDVLADPAQPDAADAARIATSIRALRSVIATDVVSALGVTTTFSDNDGDS